jgi:hypothetical protein
VWRSKVIKSTTRRKACCSGALQFLGPSPAGKTAETFAPHFAYAKLHLQQNLEQMSNARAVSEPSTEQGGLALFRALGDYAGTASRGRMRKGALFSLCVRASWAKCYEFNLYAWEECNAQFVFFSLPTLRGICEELIVLNYVKDFPKHERDQLLSRLMDHEVHKKLTTQEAFFSAARPLQPVLPAQLSPSGVQTLEDEIRSIWRVHGWPNMNRDVMPPIRQIAEKRGGDVLAKLYDYLYRLTSGTVHFGVGALLRTGWGDKPECSFSVRHFTDYYAAFGQVYGAFMFCVYFELSARILRPGKSVQPKIAAIRSCILSRVRWPEMITFEEMNVPVPDPGMVVRALGVLWAQRSETLLAR